MKVRLAALASAIAALAIAPHASAAVFDVTYQGIVTALDPMYSPIAAPVLDVDNFFGGGDLSGDAMTVTYAYDTTLGTLSSTVYPMDGPPFFPGPDVDLDGGVSFGTSSPILSATFTIDGYSYTYTPDFSSDVSTGYGVFDVTDGDNDVFGSTANADALSGAESGVTFATDDAPSTNLLERYTSTGVGFGSLDTAQSDAVTFALLSVSAAPEPSTWALMIAGFGVAGYAMRRRGGLKPAAV